MSGISSGIGLVSGIDTASLIDQLIAIERRPIDNLQIRVSSIEIQRAAFLELSAQLLAVQNSLLGLGRSSFFRAFSASSTNDKVLSASASDSAAPGSFSFRVRSLVANHAVISRGFADADTSPVGIGTLSIEGAGAKVAAGTELDALNGGSGVRRGLITITDRAGGTATIDLSTALTLDDVLDAINTNSLINVRASVTGLASDGATGDRIIIEDLNDDTLFDGTERLIVADLGSGSTAADLGIAASVAGARIDGRDLVTLSASTPLSILNDGLGVGRLTAGPDLGFKTALGDFTVSLTSVLATQLDTDLRALNSGNGVRLGVVRITDRGGASADIDLSDARTIRDVVEAINAAGLAVSATLVNSSVQIVDSTVVAPPLPDGVDDEDLPPVPKLIIEDVTGFLAADLGIAGEFEQASVAGKDVYRVETIGDVINAINYAPQNNSLVRASISKDGNGITLTSLAFGNSFTVVGVEGSTAAQDLGLLDARDVTTFDSRHLIGGLNTVLLDSLNGGNGIDAGDVRLTDRAGNATTIDFSFAHTLRDVVDLINADTATGFVASINDAGNGIMLRDESGGTNPQLTIEDVSGSLAAQLGIAVANDPVDPFVGNVVNGGSAERQYISRRTELAGLNAGQGIAAGTFQITDSVGGVLAVTIDDSDATIGDVIDAINLVASDTLEARINDTGDGIVIIDTSGGTDRLTIEDRNNGRTASDLRLAGTASSGENFKDGSFEIRIDIGANDTLDDVALKINNAGLGVSASVINHGGGFNPFSLTLTSGVSGRAGEMVIGSTGVDLGLSTLSRPQDAVITLGDESTGDLILVTSSTNTMNDVVEGVSLNLLAVSDEPVAVTVSQDVDSIVQGIEAFVSTYNGALDAIERSTTFDTDTLERGTLFGDTTVNLIRSRLQRAVTQRFDNVDPSVSRLFSVGLRLGSGSRLEFDEERFREVYDRSPEAVERLFTQEETGVGAVLVEAMEQLTRSFDGVVARKNTLLVDQQELLNQRIESLNLLLNAKRVRLEAQFAGLESALAGLQGQQSALATLTQLAGNI